MNASRRRLVALALAVFVHPAFAADVPSTVLAVGGNVAQPATYTLDALQALPQHEVALPAPDGRPRLYRGVLLRDLVALAKPVEAGRFDLRRSLIVARATDGYLALFTWAELFNTPAGDSVLVAWSLDGAPLGDGEGAFALVAAQDLRSGPRHVRWLEAIDLRRIDR